MDCHALTSTFVVLSICVFFVGAASALPSSVAAGGVGGQGGDAPTELDEVRQDFALLALLEGNDYLPPVVGE